MSEKAVPQTEPSEEDVNTTPPNPTTSVGNPSWKMPEPVFRKSSGYLPEGFDKRYSQDEIKTTANEDDSTAEMRVPEIATGIEPQPEIEHTDDTFNADRPSTTTALPKRGSSAKLIFTVIGLLIVLALIAVIAAVIYFLYLMPGPESTF